MDRAARPAPWEDLPDPAVLPSLLACDFSRMDAELAALAAAGVRIVHLDVMDGHFVPNLTYGAPVIASWRKSSDALFDAHLMLADPARYLEDFLRAGCDQVTVHIEVLPDPTPVLRAIRAAGAKAGLALNPPTPVEDVLPFLDEVDSVLVMSVMPGFGGQAFDPVALPKLARLRREAPGLTLAVDGGINAETAPRVVAAGAGHLVAGSSVFRSGRPLAEAIGHLADAARAGLSGRGTS
jgi:ribulose-phosphate 3-epimerase